MARPPTLTLLSAEPTAGRSNIVSVSEERLRYAIRKWFSFYQDKSLREVGVPPADLLSGLPGGGIPRSRADIA